MRRAEPARGLVALVRLGGSSSIARGGNGRPCVLNVLANLCDDVRANCDIPAILQALGALGCASSLEYLFETLRDHPDPVTLVFERSGTGILLHAAEAGGGECSACARGVAARRTQPVAELVAAVCWTSAASMAVGCYASAA